MFEHPFLEKIPLYAIGAVSGEEKAEIERHLQGGCDLCQEELAVYSELVGRLAYAAPQKTLPVGLKQRIQARIEREPAAQTARKSPLRIILPLAAILAIALLASTLMFKSSQLQQRETELARLEKLLSDQKQEIAWLRDPSVQLAMLSGLAPASGAKGKMVWNPTASKGIFYVNYLPQLPKDKSYQLWVIGNKGPVSAGVFQPDPNGSAVLTISRIQSPAPGVLTFAVTIEPHGGRPQPTGSMVLKGNPI